MILVDIFVPAVDKTYNLSLNEHVALASVIEEIAEMIEQKEKTKVGRNDAGAASGMIHLYRKITGSELPADLTLADCEVKSGESLILV